MAILRTFREIIFCQHHVKAWVQQGIAEATALTVKPDSEDDWEAVELNADEVTYQLLGQVRIVSCTKKTFDRQHMNLGRAKASPRIQKGDLPCII